MDTENRIQALWHSAIEAINALTVVSSLYELCVFVIAGLVAFFLSKKLKQRFASANQSAKSRFQSGSALLPGWQDLLLPAIWLIIVNLSIDIAGHWGLQNLILSLLRMVLIVWFIYELLEMAVKDAFLNLYSKWFLVPVALIYGFGFLDEAIAYLSTITVDVGVADISAFGVLRSLFFGGILFWLGRIANQIGQRSIRKNKKLDLGMKELLAKLWQVGLVILVSFLLLPLLGINLTTLAVFGGALGVGLGFGLQSIAANFISGIIILLDRSLSVGDYVELENGKQGRIRSLHMRYAILETYDGKDIMVPNEQFISTNFINWTHKDPKQRYEIRFQVSYQTDLDVLFPLLKSTVAQHPKVISGEDIPEMERPDAEISGFGDSGIDILVEFWMFGIDDGENRVGGDLYYMIWKALKEHKIEIPYPRRDVVIVGQQSQ